MKRQKFQNTFQKEENKYKQELKKEENQQENINKIYNLIHESNNLDKEIDKQRQTFQDQKAELEQKRQDKLFKLERLQAENRDLEKEKQEGAHDNNQLRTEISNLFKEYNRQKKIISDAKSLDIEEIKKQREKTILKAQRLAQFIQRLTGLSDSEVTERMAHHRHRLDSECKSFLMKK